jgi:hypothetical protein
MNPNPTLREATVQEIQLELIRRSSFNAFDGEKVAASLLDHRDLWLAALLDHPGLPDYTRPGTLLLSGLIKLRDVHDNYWNVDTLFVLTQTPDSARQLARIVKKEQWGGMLRVYEDQSELGHALGCYGKEYGLLRVWWD